MKKWKTWSGLRLIANPVFFLPYSLIPLSSCHSQAAPSLESTISDLVLSHSGNPRALSQNLQATSIQWTPSLVDSVIKRLWNHGPRALLFFESLNYFPNYAHFSSSFDLAIDISARMRDYKRVWYLISRLHKRGFSPSPRTFAIIAERLVSMGKPHRAVRLFLSMHHHNCPQTLSSFNTILDILCKSKRVEMAYTLFKTFKRRFPPDVITYNIIANGWCIVKKSSKAVEILKEMVEVGLVPSIATYNLLLKGFFRSGQVKHGYKFFNQMKERGGDAKPDVVTYTTVIHGLGVTGETEKAKRVFEMMIGDGCLPSVATYNALVQSLCKKDTVDNAIQLFDDMIGRGYLPNVTTYNVIIRGLCHVGAFDKAMEYVERMRGESECEPNVQTFNVLIRYLCEAGEIDRGFQVFRSMTGATCLPNLDTYNILISGSFGMKRAEWMVEAGKLLVEMVERGFFPRKFIFNRVLNGLLLTGNQGFAKEILNVHSQSGRIPRKIIL